MDDADTPFVLHARDARGAVTLTLNRPSSFNALSEGMLGALEQALGGIAADDTVRAVVIAAAGKAFCAGHDLKEMRAEPSLDYYRELFERCGAMMLSIQRLPVPVIARVHGCTALPRPRAASWWRCATWRWRRATRASRSAA